MVGVTDRAHPTRLPGLAALTAGVALFASSLAGIAGVDRTLSAATPAPQVQELRVVEPLDAGRGSDCPRERARHLRAF